MTSEISGWSETYYTQQTSLDLARSHFLVLLFPRATLMASPAKIVSAMVADDNAQNVSYQFIPNGLVYFPVAPSSLEDTPWQSVLCRLIATGIAKRPLYLRGLPDFVFDRDPAPLTANQLQWNSNLLLFLSGITNNNWLIKSRDRGVGNPRYPVTRVFPTAGKMSFELSIPPNPMWVIGDKVHLYKVVVAGQAVGQLVLQSRDNSAGTIWTTDRPMAIGTDVGAGGLAQRVQYVYPVIDLAERHQMTHRITGRPFGLQRGARRRLRRV